MNMKKITKQEKQARYVAENHTLEQLTTRLGMAQAINNIALVQIFLNAIFHKTTGQ